MRSITEPVTVIGYETWTGQDGKPFTYKDGMVVEYVEVRSEGEPQARKITLARVINGDRPAVGEQVTLVLEDSMEADARVNRDGEPFVVYKDKRKLIGFEAAASSPLDAAA